jgi:hypothetical protein
MGKDAEGGGMSKYGNVQTVVDTLTFASKAEARRYGELKLLEQAGVIQQLVCQPKYPIVVNGKKICDYIGDFAYLDGKGLVLEDVKGMKTPAYRLKKKLVLACYGIEITEVSA